MHSDLFPLANIVAGISLLGIGFGFHFLGQLASVLNWQRACDLGLQERDAPRDYYPYEHGTAVADVLLGWTHPVAALGLMAGAAWAYPLAAVLGSILLYHGLSAWFWERDRRRAGHGLWSNRFRAAWCAANVTTGALTLAVSWAGPV